MVLGRAVPSTVASMPVPPEAGKNDGSAELSIEGPSRRSAGELHHGHRLERLTIGSVSSATRLPVMWTDGADRLPILSAPRTGPGVLIVTRRTTPGTLSGGNTSAVLRRRVRTRDAVHSAPPVAGSDRSWSVVPAQASAVRVFDVAARGCSTGRTR